MATTTDPGLKALYARLYGRNDLRGSSFGLRLLVRLATVWLLCGVLNLGLLDAQRHPATRPGAAGVRLWSGLCAAGPAAAALDDCRGRQAHPGARRRAAARRQRPACCACCRSCSAASRAAIARAGSAWRASTPARQGRLPLREVRKRLRLDGPGLPLALVEGEVIGIPFGADRGHVAVIAPTRSGKGLHLTETLLRWPGAAVVLDPKGEQWTRTAGTRAQLGPVYRLPEQGIDLADAFRLTRPARRAGAARQSAAHLEGPRADLRRKEPVARAGRRRHRRRRSASIRWRCWRAGCEVGAGLALAEGFRYAPSRILQFTDTDRLPTRSSTSSPNRPGAP